MSEDKEKRYVTEWSFSFEKLNDQISDFVKSMGMKGEEQIKTGHYTEPVGSATSARVRLDFPVGRSTIKPLVDSDTLIDADLTYVGEISFTASGETEKVVNLSQDHAPADWFRGFFGWIGSGQKLHWDVGLTTRIPLDLEIHNGVGECEFDLGALKVSALRIAGGTGEIHASLPTGQYSAHIDSGVGEMHLDVPPGATIDLQANAGTGEIALDIADGAVVTANVRGGIGEMKVRLPQSAAARIEYRSGIGGANVPSHFTRISSIGDAWNQGGVWQTPNYDTAEHKILIHFEGGIGGLKVL
jgi:hypothetical protein